MIKEKSVQFRDNSEVRLTITVPRDDVRGTYDGLVDDYCKKAQIPGFRRGRVPPAVLVRKFREVLLDETEEAVVKKSFDEALGDVERKPLPYSTPYIVSDEAPGKKEQDEEAAGEQSSGAPEAASQGEPAAEKHAPISLENDYTFTIAYDTYPEVELGEYRGIGVEKPEYEITDEDINRELASLQEQNALVVDKKDGVVEKGNVVTVSHAEIDEAGTEKRGTRRDGLTFEVGTGYNLYDLDADVIGMKVDDEKTLDKVFPEDYQHQELAGKNVRLKVTVSSIREKNLPALDDELAQDISDKFETLEDLKADIRKRLEETAQAAVRSRMIAAILDSIYQSSTVPVPRAMVNLQLASNWQTLVRQLRGDERAADRYLSSLGRTRDGMLEQWKPEAERRLKSSLIVVTIMDKEHIEVADEDVTARLKEIAERRGTTEEEVRGRVESEGALDDLKSQIRERKLEDFLLSVSSLTPGKKMGFLDLVRGNE